MGEVTKISWCDHTFNPWIGCTKVSPACDGCYAEALMDKRYGRVEWGAPGKGVGTRERTSAGNWHQPVRWNAAAAKAGTQPFVFCASLADVFDNQVPTAWRTDLFELIRATPNLVWLLLTKRPQNIVRMYGAAFDMASPRNAAIGTTVEDQERANINVPELLRAKAELRPAFAFLSCEPMLGPIDLRQWLFDWGCSCGYGGHDTLDHCPNCGWRGRAEAEFSPCPDCGEELTDYYVCPECKADNDGGFGPNSTWFDWVITGGETDQGGHKARPSHPGWYRSLRDQCAAAGIAYHHKQNGEWSDYETVGATGWERTRDGHGRIYTGDFGSPKTFLFGGAEFPSSHPWLDGIASPGPCMVKVGKNRTGRLLNGIAHDARPVVRAA